MSWGEGVSERDRLIFEALRFYKDAGNWQRKAECGRCRGRGHEYYGEYDSYSRTCPSCGGCGRLRAVDVDGGTRAREILKELP